MLEPDPIKRYMALAIASAHEGIQGNHGGPFGACIIDKDQVLATAHNTVIRDQDATCHAEVNAIRAACRQRRSFDLTGAILFATSEPCPMCLGAIYWARIRLLYIGTSVETASFHGFDDVAFYVDMSRQPEKRSIQTVRDVMIEPCRALFDEWKLLNRTLY